VPLPVSPQGDTLPVSTARPDSVLTARTWLALVAMGFGVFVIANDFTALSVAIPRIEQDLHTTLSGAQWVINGYALVFGVLIVTGGRLADLLGRKRMFMAGATIFALFSLLCGVAPDVGLLIVCRALMGVGGALMWPAILGLTYSLLPADRKGLAGGLILGVAGLGNTVGPLLGGWLTDVATWRLVFFVNLPVTVFAMFVTRRRVPESRAAEGEPGGKEGIDYAGVALLSAGAIAILIGLDLVNADGLTSPVILGLLASGVALLAAFFLAERRLGARALVPADVLGNRVFAASCAAVLLMSAIFFSALLYLPQFMQVVLHYSAIRSGAGLLPMMGVFAVASFVAGSLYGRLGPRLTVSAGAALMAAGIFLLSFPASGSGYLPLVPGMCVLGVGVGLFYSAVTTAAVTALDPARSSLAGGIVYMCQIAGGAIGLGLNTAIVIGAATLRHGITVAFRADAGLAVAGFVVALAFVRGPRASAAHAAVPAGHHRVRA
jgi:EmrB/QacA subfamily drug resistance transporter